MNTKLLSLVIPTYNESGNIEELYKQIIGVINKIENINYELIFIDDGSKDDTWEKISKLHCNNNNLKGIRLSRNFGHQNALKAGIDISSGDAVISMDADLQHPPQLISAMIEKWREGFEIVSTFREDTNGVSFAKKLNSKLYYKFLNFISGLELSEGSSDFRLLDRKVVNELKNINESQLFLRGLVSWLGFSSTSIKYVAEKRFSGSTTYSFIRMLKFAIDGIMSFSIKPLRIASVLGASISLFAFIYILSALYDKFILEKVVQGWTSILVSVLFLGGVQLLSIGLLGEYVGKMFLESKKRKNYIVTSTLNNPHINQSNDYKNSCR